MNIYYKSITIQLLRFCAVDRRSMHFTSVKGIEYPSTSYSFLETKRPGSSPGLNGYQCDISLQLFIQLIELQLQTFANLSPINVSSGDDGDRTRGLRLAKALLSR